MHFDIFSNKRSVSYIFKSYQMGYLLDYVMLLIPGIPYQF